MLMLGTSDPNQMVAGLGVGFLFLAGLWRFIGWVRDAPQKPDPWDHAVELELEKPETPEVCPHCSTPQEPGTWFCENCGSAVGPYNNLMPYVSIFSQGEVFRNGVTGRFRNKPVILIGYFLISLGSYTVFAPIYWFLLLSNLKRPRNRPETSPNAGCLAAIKIEVGMPARRISQNRPKTAGSGNLVADAEPQACQNGFMPQADEFAHFLQPGQHAPFQSVGERNGVFRMTGFVHVPDDGGHLLELPFAELGERCPRTGRATNIIR